MYYISNYELRRAVLHLQPPRPEMSTSHPHLKHAAVLPKLHFNQVPPANLFREKQKGIHQNAANEALGKRKVKQFARPNKKPWFTREKKEAYIKCKECGTEENRHKYIETRNKVNNRVREIKEEYWQRFSNEIEMDLNQQQLKRISGETWTKFFQELYTGIEKEELVEQAQHEQREKKVEEHTNITEDEMQNAARKLKNRKSPNEDDIYELIKYSGTHVILEYTKLFNIILKQEKLP
ncbi:hypothetical protein ILUMI_09298 [Ignelater luminosus]|uniref:Uncharacterized protein n=1 Tax=Ignelater luminosus TaxID=2038154 RepID=A0A8K0GCK3_IGNLU|nr:hypothetical protein ILUMI_09298 [Ignelater luminosus]